GYPSETINKVLVQPDGKIVAVGYGGPQGFALARYQGDGTLDASFGSGGIVGTGFTGGPFQVDAGLDGLLQPDGEVVAVGNANQSKVALARFNADGSLDSSFGVGGTVTTDLVASEGSGPHDGGNALALLPDGRIVVGGTRSGGQFALLRYLDNGSLDGSF